MAKDNAENIMTVKTIVQARICLYYDKGTKDKGETLLQCQEVNNPVEDSSAGGTEIRKTNSGRDKQPWPKEAGYMEIWHWVLALVSVAVCSGQTP